MQRRNGSHGPLGLREVFAPLGAALLVAAYLFTEGGAGDPPGGVVVTPGCENTALFPSMPPSVPSGGSPDGTGESPVLPTVNTDARMAAATVPNRR